MKPPFTITNKMLNLIVEITRKITELELEKERNLHLRKENRIRSIYSSLSIENNSLSYEQVTDIIDGKRVLGSPKEIHEVKNAYDAYEQVFKMNPYSIDNFLIAHRLMMQDLVNDSGHFRTSDVGVYDSAGNVVHVGARPQFVDKLITELFEWANTDDVPDLIKSCVIHYEIEIIHPFSDGNGRMGRLWQNLILTNWYKVFEWIPIETIVYKNQQKYYEVLSKCGRENDSTEFIEFMLKVVLETVLEFSNLEINKSLFKMLDDELVNKMNNKDLEFLKKIYPYLLENGEIVNNVAVQLSGKPSATTRRYFVKLTELGILKAIGSNKNRKYILNSNDK